MEHFYPEGRGLFQDENAPVARTKGVISRVNEHENGVNHKPWPLQLPDLNPPEKPMGDFGVTS